MKIAEMSDLHLEFLGQFKDYPQVPECDTLVLAGDILVAELLRANRTDRESLRFKNLFKRWLDETVIPRVKNVIMIPGNHEYYHGNILTAAGLIKSWLHVNGYNNVHFLDSESITIDGIRFIGTTLWANFRNGNPQIMLQAGMAMNDHRIIGYGNIGFSPDAALAVHKKQLQFVFDELEQDRNTPTVLVFHHAPSYKSINTERYGDDPINYCYVNDLEDKFVDYANIKVVFHGHTHHSFAYEWIPGVPLYCNPRGYIHEISDTFKEDLIIIV